MLRCFDSSALCSYLVYPEGILRTSIFAIRVPLLLKIADDDKQRKNGQSGGVAFLVKENVKLCFAFTKPENKDCLHKRVENASYPRINIKISKSEFNNLRLLRAWIG
ncbi:hypothetical protein BpHYR1_004973 [Brachionus plicatilis]|uniref:Uncharacterized protein n=1 Tax=Brachionus plicatilis TaxID=10195 RepID=A0A3M7T171_BRAPC|nr:hypothetical protein BpHYR1_004973 [Brachionus plicatilis]